MHLFEPLPSTEIYLVRIGLTDGRVHPAFNHPGFAYGFNWISEGSVKITLGSKTQTVTAGTLVIHFQHEYTAYQTSANDPYKRYFFTFNGSGARSIIDQTGIDIDQRFIKVSQPEKFHAIFDTLHTQYNLQDTPPKNAFYPYTKMFEIFTLLADETRKRGIAPPTAQLTQRIRKLFENTNEPPTSVDTLAQILKVSTRTVLNACRAEQDKSATEFLNVLKLEHAKRLLVQTDYKLSYIALASGFSNERYLIRRFKLDTGMTPTHWRKNQKEKTAND